MHCFLSSQLPVLFLFISKSIASRDTCVFKYTLSDWFQKMNKTTLTKVNFLQGKEGHQCHGANLKWNIGNRTHVVRSAFGSFAAHWGVDADCRGSARRRTTSTGEYLMRRTVGRTLNLILTDVKSAPRPLPMGRSRPSG